MTDAIAKSIGLGRKAGTVMGPKAKRARKKPAYRSVPPEFCLSPVSGVDK